MKMEWNKFTGKTLNVVLYENYGMQIDPNSENPFYEIVFKTGKLAEVYDDGLLLETVRENQQIKIYVPYPAIKCVEIYDF